MKATTMRLMLVLAIGSVVLGPGAAGTLDPPGPPAPTMVTLQQIYDKIGASLTGVPKTGQTGCWNATGTPIACDGTGQDGDYQKGVSVSPRFTDNGNGTVKDNLTGLIWLKNANCFGYRTWTNALTDANTLSDGACGLTDGSVDGAWRLPNVRELQSLIDYGHWNLALPAGHPFSGVQSGDCWSSTSSAYRPDYAWFVYLGVGYVDSAYKPSNLCVWPVRGGQ